MWYLYGWIFVGEDRNNNNVEVSDRHDTNTTEAVFLIATDDYYADNFENYLTWV